jgi:hypothetical protein
LIYELPHIDDFDRFDSGGMNATEAADFTFRLKAEPELAAEYDLYQKLKDGIKSFKRLELKKRLQNLSTDNTGTGGSAPFGISWNWAIAASIAAIVTAGGLFWNPFAAKKVNWQAAFVEDPGLPVLMGHSELAKLSEAMNLYRQGQYSEALNTLPATTSDTVAYYRGIFWLKLQKPDSAISYLEQIRKQHNSAYKQKADYYTAMALWQGGRGAEAKPIFKQISKTTDHPFHDLTLKILKENTF